MTKMIYTIKRADGSTYEKEVDEPDTAPMVGPSEAAPEFQRAGNQGPAITGIGNAAIRSVIGVKSLLGLKSKDDEYALKGMSDESAEDPEKGKRFAGEVLGNIAETAIPASKAAGALNLAARLPSKLKLLAAPATAALVSAGTEGVVAPGEGETYGEQLISKAKKAGEAGLWGAGLQVAGSALRRGATGLFDATKEAKDLMAQKVYPTLAQAADSPIGRFIGKLTTGVTDSSKRQNEEVTLAYLRKVAPSVSQSLDDMTTSERTQFVKHALDGEFDKILDGKTYHLSPAARNAIWSEVRGSANTQDSAREMANRAVGNIDQLTYAGPGTQRLNREGMDQIRGKLQDSINEFKGGTIDEGQARKNLIAAKNKLDELVRLPALSQEEQAALKNLNQRYADAERFFEVAKTAPGQRRVKAMDLLRAHSKLAPSDMGFATAENELQDKLLNPAVRVMDLTNQDEGRALMVALRRAGAMAKGAAPLGAATVVGGAPGAAALAPLYALSLAGQTRPGVRALTGDYPAQQATADMLRKMFPYTTAAGSAVKDEEY